MHCFTETWDVAQGALDLGFHISFSGIVTFKNAVELKDVARRVPLDRMLIETDSPYLAPVPYRGKRNQPAFVRYVGEEIARLRDVDRRGHRRGTRPPISFVLFGHLMPDPCVMLAAPACCSLSSLVVSSPARADMYEDFIFAVNNDRVSQVKELLAKGVDPNTVGPNGDRCSSSRRAPATRARSMPCSPPRRTSTREAPSATPRSWPRR